MRKLLTSLVVLGALGIAGTSHAANGTVTMGWDACNVSPITVTSIRWYSADLQTVVQSSRQDPRSR